jgi:signal transduction histidine kinase
MLAALCFGVCGISLPAVAEATPRRSGPESRILIITSQPYATEWFNSFNSKFAEEIDRLRPFEPKISYEYIDGKIVDAPELATTVVKFLQQKYIWENVDLIVGIMPAGSAFLLEYGEIFASGIPKLYVLPSTEQVLKISGKTSVGMVRSTGDAITDSIRNIRTLLPETKHLYVVAGAGKDDLEYVKRTRRFLETDKLFETATFLTGLAPSDLIHSLSFAPKNSAVMMLTYVQNKHGQPMTTTQVLREVSAQINLPIFSFYDTVFGSGIVGGNLTSTEAYGEVVAEAAHRLLSGEHNSFALTAAPRFMYDWRQLKKWNIDADKLPRGSQVNFVEYSVWDLYKWQIIGAGIVLLLQAALIALLLVNQARRRKLQRELRLINERLEETVQLRTQELVATNQELTASNEELITMNAKISVMNETLAVMNSNLQNENQERRRIETVLAAANTKLKELDQMKSMFIASMSHELRTPLNSIIGFSGMTLQEMSGPLNDEQKDNLSRVSRAARHLLALITDVIDISKIEAGKIDTSPQPFSMGDMVMEAAESVRPQIEEKGMQLKVETIPDFTMITDRRRLLQCLINFLSNAAKYSEEGTITLTVRRNDGEVEFAVMDTGIGIDAEDLSKLFEPFERVQSRLQVKAGGTGLGLYLTRKLATEVLKGTVSVESVKEVGSTFRIRVPEVLSIRGGDES